MTQRSVELRDLWKAMYFCLLLKTICKNLSENLNGKQSQILLDHPNQPTTDTIKISSKK